MELLMEKQDVAVVRVPLAQHVEIKESSLSQKIVRLPDQVHQELQGSWILNFVIVVNHQLRVEARNRSIQNPLKAACVKIAKLKSCLLIIKLVKELLVPQILLIW
jgi:hypothetical protein